jgi:molybdopterin-guanine dinucleotide biosynthesis protein A
MNPAALILSGGMSRRMGQPKAWLPFGDEVLLLRVVRRLLPVARPIVVVAAPDQTLPPLPADVLVAHDRIAGRGPLQGIADGLHALPESADFVFATAVDAPFLQPGWITRLREHADDADIVIPNLGGYRHSLAALYRRETVLPAADRLLGAGERRLLALCDALRTVMLDESDFRDVDPHLTTVQNLNTPEEYARALAKEGYSPLSEDPASD